MPMTISPNKFAVSPDSTDGLHFVEDVDALSEILHTVRLRGDTVARHAPTPPFDVTVPAGKRVLHIVERGSIKLDLSNPAGEVTLHRGDLALLARGEPHTIRSATDVASEAGASRWVTGSFAVEDTLAGPLLSVLPPAIVVSSSQPDRDWLGLSLQLLLAEVVDPRPGAAVMISRILDLLFIHTLREWSGHDAQSSPGWLTAAMDPALAVALIAIHRDPGRNWSVAELAGLAKMSRSSFADRFTRRLGQPPATYVAEYRLDRAAHLLRSGTSSVGAVAEQVGYDSEAAFSRAFRRRFGSPPLRWRKSNPQPPEKQGD